MPSAFAIVGPGKMGGNLARQALARKMRVAECTRGGAPARAIVPMRHGFGGHPFGADKGVGQERRAGRVGGFPHEEP
jgi:hypothetical protein